MHPFTVGNEGIMGGGRRKEMLVVHTPHSLDLRMNNISIYGNNWGCCNLVFVLYIDNNSHKVSQNSARELITVRSRREYFYSVYRHSGTVVVANRIFSRASIRTGEAIFPSL